MSSYVVNFMHIVCIYYYCGFIVIIFIIIIITIINRRRRRCCSGVCMEAGGMLPELWLAVMLSPMQFLYAKMQGLICIR